MRVIVVVIGIVIASASLLSGCGIIFFRLAGIDAPHPSWWFSPGSSPGPQTTPQLGDDDYVVWTSETEHCTLVVRHANGSLVGRSEGTSCSVSGHATSHETWTIEATATGAHPVVNLGEDVEVFPSPFSWLLALAGVGFALGVITIIASAFVPREDEP